MLTGMRCGCSLPALSLTNTEVAMSDAPSHDPAHRPTVEELLESMRRQGITDLHGLATAIVEGDDSDESATESTLIWSGDSYVYRHVSIPTTETLRNW
jgi:hypothetical protein